MRYLYDLAQAQDIGEKIDLIPAPADPKDLFQFVAAPATSLADKSKFPASGMGMLVQ